MSPQTKSNKYKIRISFLNKRFCFNSSIKVKGALVGLRRFLATENPLKTIKSAFYFTLKALFVLKIFKFLF